MNWETAVVGLESDVIPNRARDIYMRRHFVVPSQAIRFHNILLSDMDPDLHDHPWDFVSLILDGTYIETTLDGEQRYTAGDVIFRSADTMHKLTLPDGPVWTYVTTGPVRKRWGFLVGQRWVHWKEYLQ